MLFFAEIETGRQAHLNGTIATALMAQAPHIIAAHDGDYSS